MITGAQAMKGEDTAVKETVFGSYARHARVPDSKPPPSSAWFPEHPEAPLRIIPLKVRWNHSQSRIIQGQFGMSYLTNC